jgi:sarcosine oxidase/L-pipecolate oxidase
LWERFSPENFPVITLDRTGGAALYSLPRTGEGVVKVAYRGTKYVLLTGSSCVWIRWNPRPDKRPARYTNYADVKGNRISVPKTANVTEEKETNIPIQALNAIKCEQ